MTDHNQFGSAKPTRSSDPQRCAQCENMLSDALDGTLSAADQATFDLHLVGCPACSEMYADARRGAAWMEMLKSAQPEPPAALFDRIIAQTSGQTSGQTSRSKLALVEPADSLRTPNTLLGRPATLPTPAVASGLASGKVLPFRSRVAAAFNFRAIGQTMLQPRLAMTAAMAFFSLALTMNLTGVKLSDLRSTDLRPSSIKRGFYEANARVTRYYANLRVVYELESRVHDLQRDNDSPASTAPAATPDQKPADTQQQKPNADPAQEKPRPHGPGTSRRENPTGNLQFVVESRLQQNQPGPHQMDRSTSSLPPAQTFVSLVPSVMYHHTKQIEEGGLA